ncbi:MAG: Gfo/Idh/MocA family oxidoreductase [Candidatus Omnitrophica bacterium]|nr:Gfo/Idh/MocA family oxidoreductase [Candidatus Omnitrophota bacterium]
MTKIEGVLVGAGARGFEVIGKFAKRFPHKLKIVAVAEPNQYRRELFAREFEIPKDRQFETGEELLSKPQLAPVLFNMTIDSAHLPITRKAVEKGYHVFLEKPIADTPEGCGELYHLTKNSDRIIQLGLCLRFTSFFKTVKEIIKSGKLGDIVTIEYQESISISHMAHSFVRGNWRKMSFSEETTISEPLIVTKSCHDMDILVWLLERKCEKVSSFGSLKFFNKKNKPKGAPERCTDGCPYEHICPFSAIKLYVLGVTKTNLGFGSAAWYVCPSDDPKERIKTLQTSPYGRCVFECDNNVVDHQVVNMEFENEITVSFTFSGFAAPSSGSSLWGPNELTESGRRFTIWGTKGILSAPTYGHLEFTDHLIGLTEKIQTGFPEGSHGGGDFGMIHNFLDAVEHNDRKLSLSSLEDSFHGHMIAFAAEISRLKNTIIDVPSFEKKILEKTKK